MGQFENLVFVILSSREYTRLIARAPFQIIMYFCLHLVVGFIIGNGVDPTEISIVPTKAPNTIAADDNFCYIFLDFPENKA